jgi:Tol biopolymer transport system component
VFATDRDGGDWEVYTVGIDGSNPRNLTRAKGMDYSPNWSPDGKSIVFVSERDGNPDLYIMDADGGNQHRVTHDPTRKGIGTAAWSPDGKKLVYMAAQDGQIEIMVREIVAGQARQLTHHNAPVWNPKAGPPVNVSAGWSPDGSAIVFVRGSLQSGQASSQLMIMDERGHAQPLLPHAASYADYAPHWRS